MVELDSTAEASGFDAALDLQACRRLVVLKNGVAGLHAGLDLHRSFLFAWKRGLAALVVVNMTVWRAASIEVMPVRGRTPSRIQKF